MVFQKGSLQTQVPVLLQFSQPVGGKETSVIEVVSFQIQLAAAYRNFRDPISRMIILQVGILCQGGYFVLNVQSGVVAFIHGYVLHFPAKHHGC